MSKKNLKKIVRKFKRRLIDSQTQHGDEIIMVKAEDFKEIMLFLRNQKGMEYNMLKDLTCVDYDRRKPRFEMVYVLYSLVHKHHIRIRVPLEEEKPTIETVSDIWKAANWAEREVWDMYGIHFEKHPDLRRILLYEEFEGHPLRKDYPIQKSQPRMDLLTQERDAHEEYRAHCNITRSANRVSQLNQS